MPRVEETVGRARVHDSTELENYYSDLGKLKAGALWTVANEIEPWEPKSKSVPVLWKFKELRDLVLKSADLVTPEQAGRRVVMLVNPERKDVSAAVGWLYTGLQTMNPGESTSAHRHMASALRFIMEGNGAYTIVDGHKIELRARDFVLTPNGTWHDHGVSEDGAPCIWQDGLDIPLMNALDANFYSVHPEVAQKAKYPVNDSALIYGGSGVIPLNNTWEEEFSPLMVYRWDKTYGALLEMSEVAEPSSYDGFIMRYCNPQTGGHPMKTMGATMQLLPAGFKGRAHRHTGSFVYQVAKGQGYSIINGIKLEWQEKDIFCLPSWATHQHFNSSKTEDACLFTFNDLPVMDSLGLYYEEDADNEKSYQKKL